jgi:dCMP deaminase
MPGVHEQNAVIHGVFRSEHKRRLHLHHELPCVMCAKILVNAGIIEVIYKDYEDPLSKAIANESKVVVRRFELSAKEIRT